MIPGVVVAPDMFSTSAGGPEMVDAVLAELELLSTAGVMVEELSPAKGVLELCPGVGVELELSAAAGADTDVELAPDRDNVLELELVAAVEVEMSIVKDVGQELPLWLCDPDIVVVSVVDILSFETLSDVTAGIVLFAVTNSVGAAVELTTEILLLGPPSCPDGCGELTGGKDVIGSWPEFGKLPL